MAKLRFGISMSLDGYVAGPDQSQEQGLGRGGEALHEWVTGTRSWREMHGLEGGTAGPDDEIMAEGFRNVGASIMGRNMFGPVRGPWGEDPWRGWWGDEPPFHHPVFVLTHHAREPLEMAGGTTFHFVTDGIHAALERAVDAASGKDVHLGGGADVANQYLAAGLVDEMEIHMVPVLLGGGARLFEGTGGGQSGFELVRAVHTDHASHFRYGRGGP